MNDRIRRRLSLVVSISLASAALLLLLVATGIWPRAAILAAAPEEAKTLDPAAWGSDHVGQELPDYMDSGECLFCHREAIGVAWAKNKHNATMRDAEPTEPAMQALAANPATKDLAAEVQLILGDTRANRFIKRSERYGHADILPIVATYGRGSRARLEKTENATWDTETFALKCAGCHATGIVTELHAYSAVSIECFSCHGDAPAEHANDPKIMPLARARKDSAAVVTSQCASCHIRFGRSKATELPYATNFVAGDNLFKDFEVDWSQADNEKLNPGDRHVMMNIRDVVLLGKENVTCLSCHDIHGNSSRKHQTVAVDQSCALCHEPGNPIKGHKTYEVHSERCEY